MKTRSILFLAATGCAMILAAIPAVAHHAFAAEFDATKVVTLTGKVTKVEWANPHTRIYFDVRSDTGQVVNWDFEMGSPNGLMRLGWRRDSLKPGDEITVNGTLAKNAPHVGNARTVTMVKTGRRMLAGSSEGEPSQP